MGRATEAKDRARALTRCVRKGTLKRAGRLQARYRLAHEKQL